MPKTLLAISQFQGEIERLFREALSLASAERSASPWQPAVDVAETADFLTILVEVPGLSAADLAVEVHGDTVRLSGEKRPPRTSAENKHACLERDYGTFERDIELRGAVNTHRGRARLAGGLLTLEFPKIDEQREAVRRIEIEESESDEEQR
ncbi:MAG: Hsp20/alpha crystallin family protein, partial [Planctomycetota bacterium]